MKEKQIQELIKKESDMLLKNMSEITPLSVYIRAEEKAVNEYNKRLKVFRGYVDYWNINDISEDEESWFLKDFLIASNNLKDALAKLIEARQALKEHLNLSSNY